MIVDAPPSWVWQRLEARLRNGLHAESGPVDENRRSQRTPKSAYRVTFGGDRGIAGCAVGSLAVAYAASVSRTSRLVMVLGLNVVLIAGLVSVGVSAHSLAVVAAGGDYLADATAIGLSLFAIGLSRRQPTVRRPHGYPNATTAAAFVNGLFLLIVVTVVSVAAARRLASGTQVVHGMPVLIASSVAAIAMVVGAVILRGDVEQEDDDDGDRANMRAVLLDTIADAAAAGGVAAAGLVIAVTGRLYWLDPAVALAIAIVIGYHVLGLLTGVLHTLRQPIPRP
jgi:cobalt-zinc-cadmium efflux system protein